MDVSEIEVPNGWDKRSFAERFVINPFVSDSDIQMGTVSALPFDIECQFCPAVMAGNIETYRGSEVPTHGECVKTARLKAMDMGWRQLESDEFGQSGTACPSCVLREMKYRLDLEAAYQKGKTNE